MRRFFRWVISLFKTKKKQEIVDIHCTETKVENDNKKDNYAEVIYHGIVPGIRQDTIELIITHQEDFKPKDEIILEVTEAAIPGIGNDPELKLELKDQVIEVPTSKEEELILEIREVQPEIEELKLEIKDIVTLQKTEGFNIRQHNAPKEFNYKVIDTINGTEEVLTNIFKVGKKVNLAPKTIKGIFQKEPLKTEFDVKNFKIVKIAK